jgi:hypothetical protein
MNMVYIYFRLSLFFVHVFSCFFLSVVAVLSFFVGWLNCAVDAGELQRPHAVRLHRVPGGAVQQDGHSGGRARSRCVEPVESVECGGVVLACLLDCCVLCCQYSLLCCCY